MNNDFAGFARSNSESLIGEHGFTAILREREVEPNCAGIIGAPRIGPTCSGLSIEDGSHAAIDAVLIRILEDFARRENIDLPRLKVPRAAPLACDETSMETGGRLRAERCRVRAPRRPGVLAA